jgi:anaerobic magnesium-protoporphyrin IX monomethyl ester cyclase
MLPQKSRNKKVLFINPPLSLALRYGKLGKGGGSEPPLGLCYLAAKLLQEGFDSSIIDAQVCNLNAEEVMMQLKKIRPDYVAITSSTMSIEAAEDLAGRIKGYDKGIKVIIGGCHFSALPEETLLECDYFDAGISGEGEEALVDLINAFDSGGGLEDIPGVFSRRNGQICFGGPRMRIKDLDTLPVPAFDLLPDITRYYKTATQNLKGKNSFSLVTSRGCIGACTFCDNKVFGNRVTLHSAEYIYEMIRLLNQRYKVDNILFEDDSFFVSAPRLKKFVSLLSSHPGNRIYWSALARVDQVSLDLLKAAKEGGCWQVSYGIESASRRILDLYKKNINKEQIMEAVDLAKSAGLKVKGLFMWGNPGEDKSTIKETGDLINSLRIDDVAITFFTPYPGASIWKDITNYGITSRDRKAMSCYEPVFLPLGLSREYLLETRKKVLMSFYLRPRIFISYIFRITSFRQLKEYFLSFVSLLNYIFGKDNDAFCNN